MTPAKRPNFFYGYVIVLITFLTLMLITGAFYSFGVFFKPVIMEFGWTRAATAGAFSLCLLANGFISIFTGRLSDRFGPRLVMTGCGLFLGAGYLLMSQINTIWHLYLFYGVLIGVGMSGGFVVMTSTIARWFVNRRGLMIGVAVSGIGFGTVIVPPIANWLISSEGWRMSYILIGITILILVVSAAQFLRREPDQMGMVTYFEGGVEKANSDLGNVTFSLLRAVHTRQFWIICMVYLCFGFSLQAIMVHIVPHATDLAISAASAASILAVIGVGSIAGRIIMGTTADRIGNRLATTICFCVMSADLLWLLVTNELWMFYPFAAIFGFTYGGLVALMSPLLAELFGLGSLGVVLGVVHFIWTIGEAVGPALAGRIFDTTGSYQLAFLVCAVLGVITIILALFLRPITDVSIKRGH